MIADMRAFLRRMLTPGRGYVMVYTLTAAVLVQDEIRLHEWVQAAFVTLTWVFAFRISRAIWRLSDPK